MEYVVFKWPISQQDEDLDRTVGINTGHVGTSDFTLEEEDRSFVVAVSVDLA